MLTDAPVAGEDRLSPTSLSPVHSSLTQPTISSTETSYASALETQNGDGAGGEADKLTERRSGVYVDAQEDIEQEPEMVSVSRAGEFWSIVVDRWLKTMKPTDVFRFPRALLSFLIP